MRRKESQSCYCRAVHGRDIIPTFHLTRSREPAHQHRIRSMSIRSKLFALALCLALSPAQAQSIGGGIDNGAGSGGGGGGGTPGGTNGQIQFNNSSSFGGLTPAIATACGG